MKKLLLPFTILITLSLVAGCSNTTPTSSEATATAVATTVSTATPVATPIVNSYFVTTSLYLYGANTNDIVTGSYSIITSGGVNISGNTTNAYIVFKSLTFTAKSGETYTFSADFTVTTSTGRTTYIQNSPVNYDGNNINGDAFNNLSLYDTTSGINRSFFDPSYYTNSTPAQVKTMHMSFTKRLP